MAKLFFVLCPLMFLAGFIDSVAGGGGLITTPSFLLAGLPYHNARATYKVCSSFGTTFRVYKYIKSGNIRWKNTVISALFSSLGGFLGARIMLLIDRDFLKKGFTVILPFIAAFVIFSKKSGDGIMKAEGAKLYVLCARIGLVIGMYDGLIGPGTGSFLIFAYTTFVRYDYVTAASNAKIVNWSSKVTAALSLIVSGKVMWLYVLPAAGSNALGNWLGSSYALKHGKKAIRTMLILVLIAVFVKLLTDIV